MNAIIKKASALIIIFAILFNVVACTERSTSDAISSDTESSLETTDKPGDDTNSDDYTSELPVVKIDTAGASINSKENYTTMTFDLDNCDEELTNVSGGIRLRGNSTLSYPKKAYRVKFDKKQSMFGLTKAKSWVLLADYLDPSTLHNHAALTLASKMPGFSFTPTPFKVNLYLNGEYKGIYTLCEQVQENEGRIDIELPEITSDMKELTDYNWFISLDINAPNEPGAERNVTWFNVYDRGNGYATPGNNMPFELKYPEKSQFPSEEQFNDFMLQLKTYVRGLVDAFANGDVETLKREVNMNSLIDYVIIDEIMGQEDHDKWFKSFNIYYTGTSSDPEENGKVNFGPIWDYDWCLGTPWTNAPNTYYQMNSDIEVFIVFYQAVFNIDEFYNTLKYRFKQYAIPAIQEYISDYDALIDSMSKSLEANRKLWYTYYPKNITEKNLDFLKDYLTYRMHLLEAAWS